MSNFFRLCRPNPYVTTRLMHGGEYWGIFWEPSILIVPSYLSEALQVLLTELENLRL